MKMIDIYEELRENSYPGRGIIIGKSSNGKYAVTSYFIMGRSLNSRNRVFTENGDGIRTEAADPRIVADPHLIIYSPVRVVNGMTVITNGDQTDTVCEYMNRGKTFEQALRTREYEDDVPNCTPRISGIMYVKNGFFDYSISILKSNDGTPGSVHRFTYSYSKPVNGEGHFIHTYMGDGDPLPSFEGEPKKIFIPDDINVFSDLLWKNLNEKNKISLFVRYIDIETGEFESRIINKYSRKTM